MYGYIYLTTNLINGKKYIGKHTTSSMDDTYVGSGTLLKKAISKYGIENFQKEIICIAESRAELALREVDVMLKHNAVDDPNYYNIAAGGEGGKTGTTEQYSAIIKRYWDSVTSDVREAFGKRVSSALKGKPKSEEHKRRMGDSRRGKPRKWTKVTREEYAARRKAEYAVGINVLPEGNRGNKDFRHSNKSKALLRQRIAENREKAKEEGRDYVSPEGIEIAKIKRNAHFTPERRAQYAEDTKDARVVAEQARKQAADKVARQFLPMILDMQQQGLGLTEIANRMNAQGFKTRRGSIWTDQTVRQILKRQPDPVPLVRGITTEVYGIVHPPTDHQPIHREVRFIGWKS